MINPTMALVKFVIFQLIVIICGPEFHINALTLNKSSEPLVGAVIKVIKTCHETETNAIGVSGNEPDSLIASLSEGKFSVSVVLLNGATRTVDSGRVSRISRHKLQLFVIMASSSMELREILAEIKKSRWWNHMANFYILNLSMTDDGCSRAYEILSTAWKMDLSEAKFMCVDGTMRRMIYSFNPYKSDAPKPWKLKKIYRGENDHPWTLLGREYRNNYNVCDNMNFDKTKDLGGYGIRVTIQQALFIRAFPNKTGVDAIGGVHGPFIQKIFHILNATVSKLLVNESDALLGAVDGSGIATGIIGDVVNGITDIGFMGLNALTVANAESVYPFWNGGLFVMTRYRGYKSQLSKIVSVIDISSRIGVCLVILVTVIFMKYFLRQNLSTAMLNTMRLVCNSCLPKLPFTVGSRIYLSSLFVFVITITGIYQSQWAALMSKRILLPNIESMEDLAKSGYTLYGHRLYEKFFTDRPFQGRYVAINGTNCTGYVLTHPNSAACIAPLQYIISDAARFKLHLSKYPIVHSNIVYVIRNNWPLEKRINELIQSLREAHLFEYSQLRFHEKTLRTIESNKNEDKDGNIRVLTLEDLSFAFAILGFGLSCATVCFVIEIVIHRYRAWWRIFTKMLNK